MCEHLSFRRRIVTKKPLAHIVATIVSILCYSSAFAAPATTAKGKNAPEQPGVLSVSATVGGYVFGGSESLSNTALYGLKLGYDIVGKSLADSIGVEATFNYFNTSSTAGRGSADGTIYRIDALFPFTPGKKLVPIAAVGLGAISTDSKTKKIPTCSSTTALP
jgi:OmpA-OmpF porin, OOP family